MGNVDLNQIQVTPLKRIQVVGGDVLHAIRCDEESFRNFGEAYFSWVQLGAVKAWKKHLKMTLNLVVPMGSVRFVFVEHPHQRESRVEEIGETNYARLTVPPGIWFGFMGLNDPRSLILNVADIPHDPFEIERMEYEHEGHYSRRWFGNSAW